MSGISVGDVFQKDGFKWAIKLIDLDGIHPNNKSKEPRIDASKFYFDEFGQEKVRKGRPSKFDVAEVFGIFGLPVPDGTPASVGFSTTTQAVDKTEEEWEEIRRSKEKVAALINTIDDDSTDDDW